MKLCRDKLTPSNVRCDDRCAGWAFEFDLILTLA
jgi:hypothetical protein